MIRDQNLMQPDDTSSSTPKSKNEQILSPMMKLSLDLGPLILFFVINAFAEKWFGLNETQRIVAATAVFVIATLVSLAIGYVLTKKFSAMSIFSAVIVLFFGGLTIVLQDKTFIQLKLTIVNAVFGLILLGGLLFQKPLLAIVLDNALKLTTEGWRILSLRWALFFLFIAGLNEIVWRTQDWDTWANFKVFGVMPLMFVFAIAQTPLMLRHELKDGELKDENAPAANAPGAG